MCEIVKAFYNENALSEWERMDRHRMEFAITCRAMAEYLPKPPARILDLGGGPGRYAIELAKQGYEVTLADLSPEELSLAAQKAAEAHVRLAGCEVANALDLSRYAPESFDAVLVMGPLYHLLKLEERQQVVREAVQILKPGGVVLATFINRYSPLRDAANGNTHWVYDDPPYALRMLETGIHDNLDGFTQAYFSHPSEVEPLMQSAGFEKLTTLSQEGFIVDIEDEINQAQGEQFDLWVELNYRVCKDPYLLGASGHMLYIGVKSLG